MPQGNHLSLFYRNGCPEALRTVSHPLRYHYLCNLALGRGFMFKQMYPKGLDRSPNAWVCDHQAGLSPCPYLDRQCRRRCGGLPASQRVHHESRQRADNAKLLTISCACGFEVCLIALPSQLCSHAGH